MAGAELYQVAADMPVKCIAKTPHAATKLKANCLALLTSIFGTKQASGQLLSDQAAEVLTE